jgi:hypothetical protein
MNKCCALCRYSYVADSTDVSGICCEKNKTLKIIAVDVMHPFCNDCFKLSLARLLYYWIKYE